MFDPTIVQLGKYCRELRTRGDPGLNWNQVEEALNRLAQMNRLLSIVIRLDAESRQAIGSILEYALHEEGKPPSPALWHQTSAIGQDAEMFAEAFYYFAFRFRELVRSIPGLQRFEAKSTLPLGSNDS